LALILEMDKLLERVLKFFENKSIHFGLRTSIFIISVFVLTISDCFFNFSYDYHLTNKIEKLESIDNLKNIYKTDSLKLSELTELENQIFKRKHYSSQLRNLDLNKVNIFKKSDKTEIKSPVTKNDNTTINKPIRSIFWMTLSSNYFLILTFIITLFYPLSGPSYTKGGQIFGKIAGLIVIPIFIYVINLISYQIPIIYERPYINYIVNALIHFGFFGFIFVIFKLSKKKN
jgi:hypothetical protein